MVDCKYSACKYKSSKISIGAVIKSSEIRSS